MKTVNVPNFHFSVHFTYSSHLFEELMIPLFTTGPQLEFKVHFVPVTTLEVLLQFCC